MKISIAILTIILIWSCSNNNNSNLEADKNTISDTTTTSKIVDSLDWIRIDEYFEYAFTNDNATLNDSLAIKIESVGILNSQGSFIQDDTFAQYVLTEEQLFGVKTIEDIIQRNKEKSIYFKIKTDFIISNRKDLLENIIVNPKYELNEEDISKLLMDLKNLDYIEQAYIIKQETSIKLTENVQDSVLFIQLRVNQQNRNIDSLTSKSIKLKKTDSRIEGAFYIDILEQTRGQYLVIKIMRPKQSQ